MLVKQIFCGACLLCGRNKNSHVLCPRGGVQHISMDLLVHEEHIEPGSIFVTGSGMNYDRLLKGL